MSFDLEYYRKVNGLDDIPADNGTEINTEIIERVSREMSDFDKFYVSTFDLYKRQNRLDMAILERGRVQSEVGVRVYYRKIKEPTLNSLSRGIQANLNTLHAGDYITYEDKHSKVTETYMIRSKPEPKRTFEDAYMMFCNEDLIWIDCITKEVISYPCVVSHDKYIIDNQDEGFFERESSWVNVICQANNDTLKIGAGDRFLFRAIGDNFFTAHEVIDTNPHAISGQVHMKVRTVKMIPDDNVELGIANYYSKHKMHTVAPDDSDIIGDTVIYLGVTNLYTVNIVNLVDYSWSLEHVSGDLTISKYIQMKTTPEYELELTSVASSMSAGYQFDIVLKDNATLTEYLRKRIEVKSW